MNIPKTDSRMARGENSHTCQTCMGVLNGIAILVQLSYSANVLIYRFQTCPATSLKTHVTEFSQFSHVVLTLPQLSVLLTTLSVKAPRVSIGKGECVWQRSPLHVCTDTATWVVNVIFLTMPVRGEVGEEPAVRERESYLLSTYYMPAPSWVSTPHWIHSQPNKWQWRDTLSPHPCQS